MHLSIKLTQAMDCVRSCQENVCVCINRYIYIYIEMCI